MTLKLKLYAAALSVSGILISSCGRSNQVEAAKVDPPKASTVAVAKVEPADLARQVVLPAEFKPFQKIDVHSKVAGYVQKMLVDVGDHVRQGQLLAVLEIPEMQDDLTRAAAAMRRSDAELSRARDELQRAESAHSVAHLSYSRLAGVMKTRPDLVAQQEIDVAQGSDRESEAQVSAAKAALAAAEQQVQVTKADQDRIQTLYAYARITAPFTGVITKRYADTGSMIQAGTASQTQAMPVVELSENGLLRLVIYVPESAVPHIHLNSQVEVRVPTLKKSFPGKVARFADSVQLSTRTMETEVDVPNPSMVLVPGMYAEVVLTLEKRNEVLSVPVQAVTGKTDPTVMVVNTQNQLEDRHIQLGLETPDRVEVTAGLKRGEMVVMGSRSQFKTGQQVQPKVVEMAADLDNTQ